MYGLGTSVRFSMWPVPERSKVRPEVLPPAPTQAEIQVRRRRVIVTVPLASFHLRSPTVSVTPTTIRIVDADQSGAPELLVPLPEPVDPREFRATVRNGILDVEAHRLDGSRFES